MLKQPTTTYAGEKSSCIMMYKITIHSQPNKFRVLTNISPLLASNQRPPLRAPMATWSVCLTKLPRCTTRWRSRRWRSCLRLDKGEEDSQDFRGTENFVHMKINDCSHSVSEFDGFSWWFFCTLEWSRTQMRKYFWWFCTVYLSLGLFRLLLCMKQMRLTDSFCHLPGEQCSFVSFT